MKPEEVLTSNMTIKYLKTSKKILFKMVEEEKIRANKLGKN